MEKAGTLYILLARLTDEGQKLLQRDPERLNTISRQILVPGAMLMARYAVLGQYDFIMMVEAQDHGAVARLSLELGALGGLHIETLSAIPLGLLTEPQDEKAAPRPSYEPEPAT